MRIKRRKITFNATVVKEKKTRRGKNSQKLSRFSACVTMWLVVVPLTTGVQVEDQVVRKSR